jgi:hypothetical protein
MRLPRMTTRRWMITAAIGLMIGGRVLLKQRRAYFLSLAQSHQKEVASSAARGKALKSRFGDTSGMTVEDITRLHGEYDRMTDRAGRARSAGAGLNSFGANGDSSLERDQRPIAPT